MLRSEIVLSRLYTPDDPDPGVGCRTPTERGQTIFVMQHPDPVIVVLNLEIILSVIIDMY